MEKKEKKEEAPISKAKKVLKKKKVLTLEKLSEKDWKIHVFNDNLQREISSYLLKKGLFADTASINYKGYSILVFDCYPEFILALNKNPNYVKSKDFILFHKRKNVYEKWTRLR